MKSSMLILVLFLAVAAQPAAPQQASIPLTKDQVMDLVKFGMDDADLAERIKEHGIDFEPTDDVLEALRKAGAQGAVIRAIQEAKPKPLTREQVGKLVAGGVPSQRAAMLVKQHGINFLADEGYINTLRVAGGDDTLFAALREASAAVTAKLVVATSPGADVYLDGALQGRTDAQGELAIKARLGEHALKVSLKGKKDFEQSTTLAAAEGTRVEARMENLDAGEVPAKGTAPTVVAQGGGTLTAPGNGYHRYVVSLIDTRQFPKGGSLTIDITVGSGQSSASFDLYAQGVELPTRGPANSPAHAYDLAPGARTSIVYSFSNGQVFQFCAEGNWFSHRGSTNTYSFVASVR